MSITIPPCPTAGAGVHSWLLGAANRCRLGQLSAQAAERALSERITRPPKPANEIQSAVAKAYAETFTGTCLKPSWARGAARRQVPLTSIEFEPAKLSAMAQRISAPMNWRHWLWERSPKRPEAQNAFSILLHLYRVGERVLVFDCMEAKEPCATVHISNPMDCRVPAAIRAGGDGAGIWYLCNPVDGAWHHNPRTGNPSCRSEEAITSFRYAVLESDQANPSDWIALIAQLPLRIAAIYTSGGRSIHVLVLVDAKSKQDWDERVAPFKRPFKVLGCDSGCLSAVRLTRLPQCARPEKQGFQRLLYLAPDPQLARLVDLPILVSRAVALARWKELCPRWNLEMKGHQ